MCHKAHQAEQRLLLGPAWQHYDLILTRTDGRPMSPPWVSQQFGFFVKKVGLDGLRFHDLRHSHASQLIKAGVHVKTISARLGHSNISTTMDVYGHLLKGMDANAASRLDDAFRAARGA